ncbi:carcinoembryonic antigen-related cell adhesion molecule 1 isoform X2 [Labeo rohita]|uniref:carcinoembryonic antigen-related cell adhesion molecule 1 isoform X2 n=1 Tax=Labeo rohita TaxID=84645 RepID=UPI0021E20F5F|nr:carcinoembryonic antigen-related cell adhesion molecule 1 isoform X2 [Labeo rohita]
MWIHLSSGDFIYRNNGKIWKNTPGLTMEKDGSLTLHNVNLKDTGKYRYTVFADEDIQIDDGEKEIKVYAKAPKPTVMFDCDADGNAVLTCDTRNHTDLIVSWYKENKTIQNEKNPKLFLTSAQVQENKPYSCRVSNPVSSEQSDSITVPFSTKTCEKEQLEGSSCTIKLPTRKDDTSNDTMWIHLSNGDFILRNNGKIKKNTPGLTMGEDGSLTLHNVSLKNTGKYRYTVFNAEGTPIDAEEEEIKVYAKAPKPTVMFNRDADGNAVLTCDIRDRTDLTVSWYKEDKTVQNEKNPKLFLTSAQVHENKPYSCRLSNPVSSEQSDSFTVS